MDPNKPADFTPGELATLVGDHQQVMGRATRLASEQKLQVHTDGGGKLVVPKLVVPYQPISDGYQEAFDERNRQPGELWTIPVPRSGTVMTNLIVNSGTPGDPEDLASVIRILDVIIDGKRKSFGAVLKEIFGADAHDLLNGVQMETSSGGVIQIIDDPNPVNSSSLQIRRDLKTGGLARIMRPAR